MSSTKHNRLRGEEASQQPARGGLWPVAVFAHNEATNIAGCLDSIAAGSTTNPVRAYVLANGCSDSTEEIVKEYARRNPWVQLISIGIGDKANAWNVFVNKVAPAAEVCFFVDGDVRVVPGSFDALAGALRAEPAANAAAAVPATGRSRQQMTRFVCDHRLILGNLYALCGKFVSRARSLSVRLPLGYICEDGLVTSLVKWDLDPKGPFLHERVVPCPSAGFIFPSMSPWRGRDWHVYWRRRVRYSLMHYQHELLVPLIKQNGIEGMPGHVQEIYVKQAAQVRCLSPRFDSNAVFDLIALRQIRSGLAHQPSPFACPGRLRPSRIR